MGSCGSVWDQNDIAEKQCEKGNRTPYSKHEKTVNLDCATVQKFRVRSSPSAPHSSFAISNDDRCKASAPFHTYCQGRPPFVSSSFARKLIQNNRPQGRRSICRRLLPPSAILRQQKAEIAPHSRWIHAVRSQKSLQKFAGRLQEVAAIVL